VSRASRFLEIRSLDRRKDRTGMLLENKNAVIYGAGGSIGGAAAKEFAREGARVCMG
jgi:FlaA1/EpsC-like NDP-sugar epimerase